MSAALQHPAPPIVEARDLVRTFRAPRGGRVQALRGVSLRVERGEVLGIVGESGCGKSTLARLLVGLDSPDKGGLRFDGTELSALRGADRRRFHRRAQMVFQDPYGSLNPRLTAGEALAEALRVHAIVPPAEIPARVAALLDQVSLPRDAADRRPHEFSGGQRQRIGIARALAVEPELIVADEPVSALDVSVQAGVVNLFAELRERLGLTLVFITHDLRLVRHLTERVAVMYLGKVVEQGPTASVFAAPRHPYTRALLSAVPRLDPDAPPRPPPIPGEVPSPLAPPGGCAFHPRCPRAEFPVCSHDVPELELRHGAWPAACHFAGSLASGQAGPPPGR
ncbi:ABC transporter ATP-binding protein [Roseomonas sp. BN140053]|uniref:ABC transporter ATP-binding protein n=1 Tax=Roseomonas sp. BN140053 TaxID=3391898 RepID=UPI0039ED8877